MRLVRRTSGFLVLAATLTVLMATGSEALAQQAEIAGIERVYLRPTAGTDQTPIGVLNAGDRVEMLGIEGSWTKVETANGTVGYVYHRYVVPLVEGGIPPAVPRPAAPPPAPVAPSPVPPPPAPAPTAPQAATEPLSTELAGLRAELAELKEKVQQRAEVSDTPSRSQASPAAPAPEQGVGVLAVAFLSLLVGWVLGAAFNRRRSKSQRRRLRF